MVMFAVTGFIDTGIATGSTYNVTWDDLKSMVASGAWEVAFHAGAYGHNDFSSTYSTAPYFYPDIRPGETNAQYQTRVTSELDAGIQELNTWKSSLPNNLTASVYTNVFAVPWNDYGEYDPISQGAEQMLTTIFASSASRSCSWRTIAIPTVSTATTTNTALRCIVTCRPATS